jgi:hypothetical protein
MLIIRVRDGVFRAATGSASLYGSGFRTRKVNVNIQYFTVE